MQGLKFRIQHPDGRLEELQIEGDRVLIGSGAHCDIRLPIDQAAVENIAIQSGSTGLVAEARSFQPAPTINDSPFTRTQVMQDSVLGVGQTRIWVTLSELGEGAVVKKKEEKTSPFTLVLAAVAIPICAYILIFTGNGGGSQARAPTKIPALWSKTPVTCPQSAPEAAAALADDRAALAKAKQERRPFHVQDGVAAVPLFEEAAACYRIAGKTKLAAQYAKHAAELRKDVANDFRTHRVRLEHAISVKDWATAQEEVRVLLAFMQGKQGNYVTWLSNLDRHLELTYGGKRR